MPSLEVINFIVLIFLFYILVVLLYQIYQSRTEPSRFVLPEFEDTLEETRSKEIIMKDSELKIETPDEFHGFIQIKILSSKPFDIDWGNGLRSSHLSSTIPQIFPPLCYAPGKYQITITSSTDSLMKVYYSSTYKQLSSVEKKGFLIEPLFIDESKEEITSCSNSIKNPSNTPTNLSLGLKRISK